MNTYTIYMHKNKINGKIYIGQTCQKPERRWNNGKRYKDCPVFNNAIQKYGWDNFEHIILFEGLSQNEANQKEIELIKQYNTTNRNFGYNCQLGGNDRSISEEGKEKIINSLKERWSDEYKEYFSNLMTEKWKTEEYRQKHKKAREAARAERFKQAGSACFMTEDGKKRVSQARKEYRAINKDKYSHRVKCVNTGEEFNSYVEAAKWCGLKDSSGFSKYFSKNSRLKSLGKHPETGERLQWERI